MTARRMTALRLLAGACLIALLGLPAAADEPETPEVCEDRTIELAEDEVLVERTLYFHGEAPVGNADSAQDSLVSGMAERLFMDEEEPSGSQAKVFASRPGVVGNPAFAQNQYHGYWIHRLSERQRIVCAEARVFAGTANGSLPVQLWIDQPRGTDAVVTAEGTGSGQANEVSEYRVNFGELDVTARMDVLVQLNPATPGALAFYDSTDRPSSFTYVTVEQQPAD